MPEAQDPKTTGLQKFDSIRPGSLPQLAGMTIGLQPSLGLPLDFGRLDPIPGRTHRFAVVALALANCFRSDAADEEGFRVWVWVWVREWRQFGEQESAEVVDSMSPTEEMAALGFGEFWKDSEPDCSFG